MTERFTLDEEKAREWIARAIRGEVAQDDYEIYEGYCPQEDYESGTATEQLVNAAQPDVITGPGTVEFDFSASTFGDVGYVWVVRPEGSHLKLASLFAELRHCGDSEAKRGEEAALGVLREAVEAANSILDDLDAYIAGRVA